METQCVFDTSTRVSTIYETNSITLCLDLSQGMSMMNFENGKTFIEEMMERMEELLGKLFHSRQSVGISSEFKSQLEMKELSLTVLVFDDGLNKCILFDHLLSEETIHLTTDIILEGIRQFTSEVHTPSGKDSLGQLIQQTLHLHQKTNGLVASSILLVTNGMLDFNFTTLHPLILLLIQRDIPFHTLLLPHPDMPNCYYGTQRNSFHTSNAQQLEQICHLTRGSLWFFESFSSSFFVRTIDLSVPYLTGKSNLDIYKYAGVNHQVRGEEYKSIHLATARFHTSIDTFIQFCIHDGFELTTVSVVNKSLMTLSFILPLIMNHHLKLVIHTVSTIALSNE